MFVAATTVGKRLSFVLAAAIAAVSITASYAFAAPVATAPTDTAGPGPDPVDVVVSFRPGVGRSLAQSIVERRKDAEIVPAGQPAGTLPVQGIEVADNKPIAATVERLRQDPRVLFAEPNKLIAAAIKANDPYFPGNVQGSNQDQWALSNTGRLGGLPDADIDAPEGFDLLGGGLPTNSPWPTAGYTVGVVDSGIYYGHEDLAGKIQSQCSRAVYGIGIVLSGCGDDNGHGTLVSGTLAAVSNNNKGITGVAPGAKIYMCKALHADGKGFMNDVAACIVDIVNKRNQYNIKVISLSIGGEPFFTMEAAVNYAASKGMLVVAAAGNDGGNVTSYPAGYANAVSVGATDNKDQKAPFSNTNSDVEISAPGVAVLATKPPAYPFAGPGSYMQAYGTSLATPIVAGVAAQIANKYGKSGQTLRSALRAAVDDLGAKGRDSSFGYGRVNLCLALGGSCKYGQQQTATQPKLTLQIK